jgi:hypothetical protein
MIAAEAATNQQSPLNVKITCYWKKLNWRKIMKKIYPKFLDQNQ